MTQNKPNLHSYETPHRVLVVNRGSLLDEGVIRLISSNEGLDVSTVEFESEEVLFNDIVSRLPEVVVMGQNGGVRFDRLYELLTSFSTLEKLRMIIFHSNENSVDIFSKKCSNMTQCADFVQLVQGGD